MAETRKQSGFVLDMIAFFRQDLQLFGSVLLGSEISRGLNAESATLFVGPMNSGYCHPPVRRGLPFEHSLDGHCPSLLRIL